MMKHLDNLTIHRFRGLRDLTLQDLGQINLLVGGNNSGKTSVLEAISTYCRPLDPLEWLNTSWRREIKYSRKPQLDALKWLFPQNREVDKADLYEGETYVSGNGNFPVKESREIYKEFEGIFELDENEENSTKYQPKEIDEEIDFENVLRGAEIELKAKIAERDFSFPFEIWENQRFINKKNPLYAPCAIDTVTPYSHRIEQLEVKLLSDAIIQRFKPEVIKLLQVMDSGITDLAILSPNGKRLSIYIDHQQIGIAPLSAFCDGVRRLMFIALTLSKVRGCSNLREQQNLISPILGLLKNHKFVLLGDRRNAVIVVFG